MNKLCRMLFILLMLPLVLLSGCAGGNSEQPLETDSDSEVAGGTPVEPSAEAEPSAAPITFEGTDLDGNAVSSDILSQSKLTMVNVWATYCNPCLSEMPGLGELAAEYEAEEFQIIGVVSDVLEGEDQELVERLVQQTGANYTHLLLNESIYYALLTDVTAVPTTYFLDADGTVLGTVIGAREKSAWEEIINGLLEEQ